MTAIERYRQVKTVFSVLDGKTGRAAPSEEQISEWTGRIRSGSAATSAEDFPMQEASMALTTVLQKVKKISVPIEEAKVLLNIYLEGQPLAEAAKKLGLEESQLTMYVHLSCQWALHQLTAVIAEHVDLTLWEGGQCPCCGGPPVISYFDKDGTRNLVCGSCYTTWRYKRIGCPFCGEQNHENLRVLETEDYPGWVAMVCKTCHGAIKAADLRKMNEMPDWNEAQITLLPLDFAVENWLDRSTSVS